MSRKKNAHPAEINAADVGDLNPHAGPDEVELGTNPAGVAGVVGLNAPSGSTEATEKDIMESVTRVGSGGPGPSGAPVPGSVNEKPDPTTPSPGEEAIPGLADVGRRRG